MCKLKNKTFQISGKDIAGKLRAMGVDLTVVDALSLAEEAGNAKATNVVLMGVASRAMDFTDEQWQAAIGACVPPKFIDLNRKAFELGRQHEE